MSDEIETVWIICADWSEEVLRQLAGNRTVSCSVCSEPLVMSTEGQELARQHPLTARPVCFTCAIARDPDEIPLAAPGTVERVEREGYTLSSWVRANVGRAPLKDYDRDRGPRPDA